MIGREWDVSWLEELGEAPQSRELDEKHSVFMPVNAIRYDNPEYKDKKDEEDYSRS